MRKYLPLVLFVVSLQWSNALANPFVDLIDKSCSPSAPPAPNTEFSKLLNKVQEDFNDLEMRIKYPHEFVAALDEVLAHSDFSYILKCREEIAQHGYTYRLKFQNPAKGDQSMAVETRGKLVVLYFNLTKSVQRVIFVYLHEMTHVCQTLERDRSTNRGDKIRLQLFGEVEAFFNMQLAYRKFLPLSPQLCQAKGTSSDSVQMRLSDAYKNSEHQLEQSMFAQSIVRNYMSQYKGYESELIDTSSPLHTYIDPATQAVFKLNSLDSRLKELIKRLPISVVEPSNR